MSNVVHGLEKNIKKYFCPYFNGKNKVFA